LQQVIKSARSAFVGRAHSLIKAREFYEHGRQRRLSTAAVARLRQSDARRPHKICKLACFCVPREAPLGKLGVITWKTKQNKRAAAAAIKQQQARLVNSTVLT